MRRLSLSVILILTLSASFSTAQTNAEYYFDRLILRVDKSAGDINIDDQVENHCFGIAGLDAICEEYGIRKIEKLLPWAEPPEDEELVDMSRVFTVHFPVEADLFRVIEAFASAAEVVYAEPRFIRRAFYHPNDPYFASQWGLGMNITQAELAYDYCQGDSTVSVAIVDTGMDMDHPDLVDNLWVNPGEDLNGNGIVDLIEWNAVDDDSNGYIDDFWGWDFIDDDNYPNDEVPGYQGGGHGTHCAGISSAQTDNGIGVASLGFNCSLITVRTGEGMFVYYGYEGIGYAISVMADVISLSWGGGGYSQAEQDMFDLAYWLEIVVFAAAGNDNSPSISYPAGYNHVMAVASTNANDVKSGFSSYGPWVDISAPGSSIYSTFLNGSYAYMSGTSMACPFAAGLAALVKSAAPEFTAPEIYQTITSTADDIYPQNPGYIGMLGSGRINAYQALGMMQYPSLSLAGYSVIEYGNGNGRVDPGEEADLITTLENLTGWQTATGITAYLTCLANGITVTQGVSTFPEIPGGGSGDNSSNPFGFSVSPDFEPGYVTFYFDLICQPGSYAISDSIELLIGRPEILLVDDDGGALFESYYLEPLEELDRSYEYWNNNVAYLTSDEINEYVTVIWFTGNQESFTLDAYERTMLAQYLNQGGNLILSGQYIGDEIGGETFYSDYLHSSLNNPNVNIGMLEGVAGDPISGGTSLLLVGTGGAGNGLESPSGIIPLSPAEPIYTYQNSAEIGALRYHDELTDYSLVYMEFAYEAISGMASTTSRVELMNLMLSWIESTTSAPVVTVTLTPANPPIILPASGGTFEFNVEAANNDSVAHTFDIWTMATLPNGNEYGPIIGPLELTLAGGVIIDRDRTQAVGYGAPAGSYTYDAYVGDYPDDIWDEDHFEFSKVAVDNGGPIVPEWANWGESFEDATASVLSPAPTEFSLHPPYPNPFNPSTAISYQLQAASFVKLAVYDIKGREVVILVDGWRQAGVYEAAFNASSLSSGMYFARLQAGDFRQTRKLLLIK